MVQWWISLTNLCFFLNVWILITRDRLYFPHPFASCVLHFFSQNFDATSNIFFHHRISQKGGAFFKHHAFQFSKATKLDCCLYVPRQKNDLFMHFRAWWIRFMCFNVMKLSTKKCVPKCLSVSCLTLQWQVIFRCCLLSLGSQWM